jgi:HEAT repeat protein
VATGNQKNPKSVEQKVEKAIITFRGVGNRAEDVFYKTIIALATDSAESVVAVGSTYLSHTVGTLRAAAAIALGLAAEVSIDVGIAEQVEPLLLARLRKEGVPTVAERLAGALCRAWARQDAAAAAQVALAADTNPNLRLAAAQALALTAIPPMEPDVEGALRRLAADDDERVRRWARWGLAPGIPDEGYDQR